MDFGESAHDSASATASNRKLTAGRVAGPRSCDPRSSHLSATARARFAIGYGASGIGAISTRSGETPSPHLARDPRCTAGIALDSYDLVVRGRAEPVRDPDTVAAMAQRWAEGGWPCEVDASGTALTAPFSAPSAGPPPWVVYRMTVEAATALHVEEPGGATSWRF